LDAEIIEWQAMMADLTSCVAAGPGGSAIELLA
jgi:hypothetical protein